MEGEAEMDHCGFQANGHQMCLMTSIHIGVTMITLWYKQLDEEQQKDT